MTIATRNSSTRSRPTAAGEKKLFIDYSGKKPSIVDPKTGEVIDVELFVAVLGASNYTYAEATSTQQVADWIGAHERCLVFLGGVRRDIVPDQLKSGVTGACRYEPKIQRTYEEFASHYETTVLPARPAHPKDNDDILACAVGYGAVHLGRLEHTAIESVEVLSNSNFAYSAAGFVAPRTDAVRSRRTSRPSFVASKNAERHGHRARVQV